jgi:hypothetical protein
MDDPASRFPEEQRPHLALFSSRPVLAKFVPGRTIID